MPHAPKSRAEPRRGRCTQVTRTRGCAQISPNTPAEPRTRRILLSLGPCTRNTNRSVLDRIKALIQHISFLCWRATKAAERSPGCEELPQLPQTLLESGRDHFFGQAQAEQQSATKPEGLGLSLGKYPSLSVTLRAPPKCLFFFLWLTVFTYLFNFPIFL